MCQRDERAKIRQLTGLAIHSDRIPTGYVLQTSLARPSSPAPDGPVSSGLVVMFSAHRPLVNATYDIVSRKEPGDGRRHVVGNGGHVSLGGAADVVTGAIFGLLS